MVKVFKTSYMYFPNHLIDFVYIWYFDRYRSKILFSNTPKHAYDIKVKDTDLEHLYIKVFWFKVFNSSYISDHMNGFGLYFV